MEQDSIEEIKLLMKAMKKIRNKTLYYSEKEVSKEFYDYLDRYMTLSQCLENVCWNIFGDRKKDNLKHLLKKLND